MTLIAGSVLATIAALPGILAWRRESKKDWRQAKADADNVAAELERVKMEAELAYEERNLRRFQMQDERIASLETERREEREKCNDIINEMRAQYEATIVELRLDALNKDQRIEQLEAQVEHLLQEMRRMKGMIP